MLAFPLATLLRYEDNDVPTFEFLLKGLNVVRSRLRTSSMREEL